ncbi:hypothetical protein COO60DRAFT_869981 [Scenedesmus sp. NREL 46B-D3]|nr:hypothetical protein COO60DRAFT_869981 [Scenedesmus sp. NREL 46B-D3]
MCGISWQHLLSARRALFDFMLVVSSIHGAMGGVVCNLSMLVFVSETWQGSAGDRKLVWAERLSCPSWADVCTGSAAESAMLDCSLLPLMHATLILFLACAWWVGIRLNCVTR